MFKYYLEDTSFDNIKACIKSYLQKEVPHIRKLYKQYNGLHKIKERTLPDGRPCNNIVVNFCRSIIDTTIGYINFQDCKSAYDLEQVEAIMKDTLMTGIGYGLLEYESGKPILRRISPTKALVIKDTTLAHKPIIGVILNEFTTYEEGRPKKKVQAFVYDDNFVTEYIGDNIELLKKKESHPHLMGSMPLLEARSSLKYESIYGSIIDLNDAFNMVISSYVDSRETFSEAFLLITGMAVDDETSQGLISAERKIINLPMENANARYLIKDDNATDIKTMLENIKDQIHEISSVPDFAKETTYGSSSGKANSFKILTFINLVRSRENVFFHTFLQSFDPTFTFPELMLEERVEEVQANLEKE